MTWSIFTLRFFIWSSIKRPKISSPHTPMNATCNPRRAAPQAKMAEDEPMVRAAVSTNFSTCPKAGLTLPVRIRSGLISPATRISNISVGLIPIEARLGAVEIRPGSGQGLRQRSETCHSLAGSGSQELCPFFAAQRYRLLPDGATHGNAAGARITGNRHLAQEGFIRHCGR